MKLGRRLLITAVLAIAAAPASAAPRGASVPDFSGIWAHQWLPGFEALPSGPTALVNLSRRRRRQQRGARSLSATTQSHSQARSGRNVRKRGEESKSHFGFHNPRNQCWPNGVPFVLASNGMQIFDVGDHLTMIYQLDQQIRTVRMNVPHPAKACAVLLR